MAEAAVGGALARNAFERCVGAAGEHLGYIWNYKKNIANLQTQVEKLKKERDDKHHSVNVAVKNAHKIKNRVKDWQDETDKISEEATQIIRDYEEKGKKMRCLMGLCPNLVPRYQFSKRACKKETDIVDAIREASEIREVSDRAIGMGKEIALSTEGCFTFDSRKSIFEDIMKTLQDETMNSVGVYGLGGMGKTTLVKQVASQVSKEKMFEEVVMASVTQKVDMKEIQGQIASMLDLKLEESSVAERSSRIHERLKGKKVLIVLDDLWTKLDLIQVGIPFGAEHMGCKVILTSRFRPVLSSMSTTKEYVLGALKEEEAWELFEEKVIHIVKNPKFLAVGEEIVKKCAGWPILIVTTAASLSKQPNLEIWEDALAQVKNMNDTNMQDIVKSAIKSISYKYLNETHKQLFLLCGLLQGDSMFEDILKYSWGWDLFVKDEVGTLEGARKRLRTLISDLKESCLLVDGRSSDHIKMHDVVRDIAISIARDDLKAFSHGDNDTDLSRSLNDDELNKCTAMIFWECHKLPCFPERLECPSLELFILSAHRVYSKPKIPDTFFERTSKLKVLDMSGFSFPTLPSTLSFLTNLQSLHLDHCDGLKDISMVGELKKLQELSLIGSTIQELPSSLGQLSKLKLLDLNRCSQLKVIPAGLISRLSRLEELHMRKSFDRWKSEEFPSNASFAELKCLPKLTCLKVQLQDAKLLAGDLNFENLKRYEVIVGDMWRPLVGFKTSIALQLGTNSINHLQNVVDTLFKRAEFLCLGKLKGINNVIPELDENGFPELKHLRIKKDYDVQYIVNMEDKQQKASFLALESLHLSDMRKVEKICNGRLMEGSFCKLTIVEVDDCNSLESLFSFSTIIALPCLQEIKVFRCNLLEEIVAKKREEEDNDDANGASDGNREKMMLTVRRLTLSCLPKFVTFFYKDKKIQNGKRKQKSRTSEMESQEIISEEVTMESEDEMASSPPLFDEVSFPELEKLDLYSMSNLTKIWSHRLPDVACRNLTTLTVSRCDNLKYLFTSSHPGVLVGLQRLTIEKCPKMKQVVLREEGETKTETIIFPQLSSIKLLDLPKLTTFCSGLAEETTTREKVETVTQPLFDEKVQFPSLKTLLIENLDSIRAIWPNTVGITQSLKKESFENNLKDKLQEIPIFQNLSEVTIKKCESLKFVFSASVARSLNQMTTLSVQDCGVEITIGDKEAVEIEKLETETTTFTLPKVFNQLMKVCVPDCGVETMIRDEGDAELEKFETGTTTFTLPKLVKIELKGLPKLECFYPKEHTIEWPALKELDVVDCDKLYVLDLLRCSGKQGDDRIVKVISSLKRLSIRSKEFPSLLELCDLLQPQLNLEELTIRESQGELSTFPSKFLYRIRHQLRTFRVCNCSFQEIFPYEGVLTDHGSDEVIFPQLRTLRLQKLPQLEYICKQDQNSTFVLNILDRLKDLYVTECPRLKNLAPSSISFRLLKRLEISNCGGLINLLQPSAAKSLEQLEHLSIRGCEMIEEVIGREVRDDDEESSPTCCEDEIFFNKLWCLTLEKLPRLTNFCSSRNYTFNFPKLSRVYVIECPNMKTFCGGITTTQKLILVFLTHFGSPVWSKGGLNITIGEIYEEREAKRLATTLPSIIATNHSEARAQEERVAATHTFKKSKGKNVEVPRHFGKSKTPRYSDPSCSNYTASSSQLNPQISNQEQAQEESQVPINCIEVLGNKESKEAQGLTITIPSIEELTKPTKEGHELRTGTSQAASSSQQSDLKGSGVAKDSISLGEFVHILQTQAVKDVSAEQVEFVEDAIGQFCTYVDKAKECLERKRAISELKLQIQVLEDENDVVASAAPRFG